MECEYCHNFLSPSEEELSRKIGTKVCDSCVRSNRIIPTMRARSMWGTGKSIGVEIECGTNVRTIKRIVNDNVTVVSDGSLRGHSMEVVSPILHWSNYERWVDDVCLSLRDAEVYEKCGLHIWMDTSDKSWWEIQNLLQYCIKHQREFGKMVSPSRFMTTVSRNITGRPSALPNVRIGKTKAGFLRALYGNHNLYSGEGQSRMKQSKRANDQGRGHYEGPINRYWWFNVHGHFHRKAVEIRLHQGTVSATKIKKWIRVWANIIDSAAVSANADKPPSELLPPDLSAYYAKRTKAFSEHASSRGMTSFPWGGGFTYRRTSYENSIGVR